MAAWRLNQAADDGVGSNTVISSEAIAINRQGTMNTTYLAAGLIVWDTALGGQKVDRIGDDSRIHILVIELEELDARDQLALQRLVVQL